MRDFMRLLSSGILTLVVLCFVYLLQERTPSALQDSATLQRKYDDDDGWVEPPFQERPPLSELVGHHRVIGNVEWLLQWAILGHEKTATTFLNNWLSQQREILAYFDEEIPDLRRNKPNLLVRRMYQLPHQAIYKRGYKSPRDIYEPHVIDNLDEYWPSAGIIVGTRHPIEWFESFYNYRASMHNHTMPGPLDLIGPCEFDLGNYRLVEERRSEIGFDMGVCTDSTRYHVHLSLLGKSPNVSSPEEDALLGPRRYRLAQRAPVRNRIFLYEAEQMNPKDTDRFAILKTDLEQFLNMTRELRPPPQSTSAEANYNPRKKTPLDICEAKYEPLRRVLLNNGVAASTWIRECFMRHPDVTVSSPDYFTERLLSWHEDPCTQAR